MAFRRKGIPGVLVGALVCGTTWLARAEEPSQALAVPSERVRLPNGLRVLFSVDRSSPTVAMCSAYDAGSRYDVFERPGTARLVEELLREGGRRTQGAEYSRLLQSRGGVAQQATSSEVATYCSSVPKSEADFSVWLEAGRMTSYALNAANLKGAKLSLFAQYRDKVEQTPYAAGFRRLHQLVFQGFWAYERVPLAEPEALDSLDLEETRAFHERHYRAENAVVSVAGDFDVEELRGVLETQLGRRALRGEPVRDALPAMPRQTSPRLSVLEDRQAQAAGAYYGYAVSPWGTRRHKAFVLLAHLLAGGEGSVLYEELVKKSQIALEVEGSVSAHRGPSLFYVKVKAARKANLSQVEQAIDAALGRLRTMGPTEAELSRAKQKAYGERLQRLQSNLERARASAEIELLSRGSAAINDELNGYQDISAREVQEAIVEELLPTRRTAVEIYPPGWVDPALANRPRIHIVSDGETLIGIAREYGTDLKSLVSINKLDPKKPIYPGQKLDIPRGAVPKRVYKVKKGDTLIGVAKRYGVRVKDLIAENRIGKKKRIYVGQTLTIPR